LLAGEAVFFGAALFFAAVFFGAVFFGALFFSALSALGAAVGGGLVFSALGAALGVRLRGAEPPVDLCFSNARWSVVATMRPRGSYLSQSPAFTIMFLILSSPVPTGFRALRSSRSSAALRSGSFSSA
jgi:hypothetical protein